MIRMDENVKLYFAGMAAQIATGFVMQMDPPIVFDPETEDGRKNIAKVSVKIAAEIIKQVESGQIN